MCLWLSTARTRPCNSGYTYAVTGTDKDSQFAAALQRLEAMNVLAGSVGSADITVELLRCSANSGRRGKREAMLLEQAVPGVVTSLNASAVS